MKRPSGRLGGLSCEPDRLIEVHKEPLYMAQDVKTYTGLDEKQVTALDLDESLQIMELVRQAAMDDPEIDGDIGGSYMPSDEHVVAVSIGVETGWVFTSSGRRLEIMDPRDSAVANCLLAELDLDDVNRIWNHKLRDNDRICATHWPQDEQ